MIILTHPCAGKTYFAKRVKGFLANPPKQKRSLLPGKYITFTRLCGHSPGIDEYEIAMILNEEDLKRNIKSRIANQIGKVYDTEEKIRNERDKTYKLARNLKIPIYDSFEEIIEKYPNN